MKRKNTLILLTILITVFSGCSVDLSSESKDSSTIGCVSDSLGQYGTCVKFGDLFLTNEIWSVYDGNSTSDGNVTIISLSFRENGVAVYCMEGQCTHADENSIYNWEWRHNDGNITTFSATVLGSKVEQYEYNGTNTDGDLLFIEESSSSVVTFSKF